MSDIIKINDNFSFETDHYCMDCIKFSPISYDDYVYTDNNPTCIRHTIKCYNHDICANLYKKLKEETKHVGNAK